MLRLCAARNTALGTFDAESNAVELRAILGMTPATAVFVDAHEETHADLTWLSTSGVFERVLAAVAQDPSLAGTRARELRRNMLETSSTTHESIANFCGYSAARYIPGSDSIEELLPAEYSEWHRRLLSVFLGFQGPEQFSLYVGGGVRVPNPRDFANEVAMVTIAKCLGVVALNGPDLIQVQRAKPLNWSSLESVLLTDAADTRFNLAMSRLGSGNKILFELRDEIVSRLWDEAHRRELQSITDLLRSMARNQDDDRWRLLIDIRAKTVNRLAAELSIVVNPIPDLRTSDPSAGILAQLRAAKVTTVSLPERPNPVTKVALEVPISRLWESPTAAEGSLSDVRDWLNERCRDSGVIAQVFCATNVATAPFPWKCPSQLIPAHYAWLSLALLRTDHSALAWEDAPFGVIRSIEQIGDFRRAIADATGTKPVWHVLPVGSLDLSLCIEHASSSCWGECIIYLDSLGAEAFSLVAFGIGKSEEAVIKACWFNESVHQVGYVRAISGGQRYVCSMSFPYIVQAAEFVTSGGGAVRFDERTRQTLWDDDPVGYISLSGVYRRLTEIALQGG
jgi:hypothetical protein